MEENLQFEKAEFKQPGGEGEVSKTTPGGCVSCAGCKTALFEAYFQVNGTILCGTCADGVSEHFKGKGLGAQRFGKALLYGIGAAVLGSLLYYAITAITGYQIGLISIAVGILVGKAVRLGSGNRGGWRYQVLAALLTYTSIAGTYLPPALAEMRHHKQTEAKAATTASANTNTPANLTMASPSPALAETKPDAGKSNAMDGKESERGPFANLPAPIRMLIGLAVLLGLALALPIMIGTSDVLSLLIIAFGVWKAWQLNRRVPIQITGPHAIAPSSFA